jgi:hypothetical protein
MRDFNDNSGIFIRIPIEPREVWMPVHYGYEVQIDNNPEASGEDEYHVTGTLYSLTKGLVPAGPGASGGLARTIVGFWMRCCGWRALTDAGATCRIGSATIIR